MFKKADLARLANVTPQTAARWVEDGCPLTNEADIEAWVSSRTDKRTRVSTLRPEKAASEAPPPLNAPAGDNLSIDDMLARLQQAEARAGEEVENASPGADRQAALRAYNQAARNRVDIEQEVVRLKRERRELVTPEQSDEIINAALRPIVAKLDTMSQSLGYKCNPSDPELAGAIIEEYTELIKAEASKHLQDLLA